MTKEKQKILSTPFGEKILKVYNYNSNSRLAIIIYEPDGELWNDLTINLPEFFLSDIDEGFINGDYNTKEKNIVDYFKKIGIIKESYGLRNYNMGKYEYVKFDLDKLKEYDPDGIEKFYEKAQDIEKLDLYI